MEMVLYPGNVHGNCIACSAYLKTLSVATMLSNKVDKNCRLVFVLPGKNGDVVMIALSNTAKESQKMYFF